VNSNLKCNNKILIASIISVYLLKLRFHSQIYGKKERCPKNTFTLYKKGKKRLLHFKFESATDFTLNNLFYGNNTLEMLTNATTKNKDQINVFIKSIWIKQDGKIYFNSSINMAVLQKFNKVFAYVLADDIKTRQMEKKYLKTKNKLKDEGKNPVGD